MVHLSSIFASAGLAAVALTSIANGHVQRALTESEITQRHLAAASAKHALGECAGTESYRKLQERAVARRQASINRARRERRLALADFLAIDHESSLTGVTADTASSTLFGDEVSCILMPEVTYGPYYIEGEYIRTDVRETQTGVDFYFDLQVIDIDTCEPVESVYMDFWHANSSGVYAGVVADGNGDSSDLSNANATFLRGVYPTDSDGVVQFISKFPGHYVERATHIHLLANYGGEVLENGTYSGGYIPHVSQFFFDQDLLTQVYATDAYAEDTAEITLNTADQWLAVASADDFDSLVEYALLGDSVEDGIFGWISVAMNFSASQSVTPAGYLTANGGVLSSTEAGGNGGGDFGGSMGGGFGGSAGGFGGSAGGFGGSAGGFN